MNEIISKGDLREALEAVLEERESNAIERFRVRRRLRNSRAFDRLHARLQEDFVSRGYVTAIYGSDGTVSFNLDWDSIIEYLKENWDEILRFILTIIPLFI